MATLFNGQGSLLANLSISAFRGLVLSNNGGVTYSGATDIPVGFAQSDAASGDYVACRFTFGEQSQKGVASGTITAADTLYAAGLGKIASTGTVTVGKALAGASDGNIFAFVVAR